VKPWDGSIHRVTAGFGVSREFLRQGANFIADESIGAAVAACFDDYFCGAPPQ
jgi:hypothetical protein